MSSESSFFGKIFDKYHFIPSGMSLALLFISLAFLRDIPNEMKSKIIGGLICSTSIFSIAGCYHQTCTYQNKIPNGQQLSHELKLYQLLVIFLIYLIGTLALLYFLLR